MRDDIPMLGGSRTAACCETLYQNAKKATLRLENFHLGCYEYVGSGREKTCSSPGALRLRLAPSVPRNQPYRSADLPIWPLSSSFLGLPYRILNINPKTKLLTGLWVNRKTLKAPNP